MSAVDHASADVARLIYGNIDDLRNSLQCGGQSRELLEAALAAARSLREGKTKVQILERALRKLPKP